MKRRDLQPSAPKRSGLRPRQQRPKKGLLPTIELLEDRRLLSTVNWTNPTSGSWDVASNWSTDTVPGPGDDVVIDYTGASPTVTIGSNVESVNSITADDPLVISGGGLTIAANSTISGGLTMTGGSLTANGSGSRSQSRERRRFPAPVCSPKAEPHWICRP
jgi:hypothetical protein